MRRTVKQLAEASGVSVRALHHYDAIGLLKPAEVGLNGYRYYGRAELLRLQQILFYRELDVSLSEIRRIMDDPSFDLRIALARHREALSAKAGRVSRLIRTIDRTLASLERKDTMNDTAMFDGFSAEQHAEFEAYLAQRFGPETRAVVAAGREKAARFSPAEKQAFLAELADLDGALAQAVSDCLPPGSPPAQQLAKRHHQWVSRSWPTPPTAEAYSGLALLYLEHPDFRARYDALQNGTAAWLAAAMLIYSEHLHSVPNGSDGAR